MDLQHLLLLSDFGLAAPKSTVGASSLGRIPDRGARRWNSGYGAGNSTLSVRLDRGGDLPLPLGRDRCIPSDYYISDGIVLIKSGQVELLQAGANPVLAGLFGGCSILLVAAYMASIGKKLAAYKKNIPLSAYAVALAITVTVIILGLCHLGNVEQSATAAIPSTVTK